MGFFDFFQRLFSQKAEIFKIKRETRRRRRKAKSSKKEREGEKGEAMNGLGEIIYRRKILEKCFSVFVQLDDELYICLDSIREEDSLFYFLLNFFLEIFFSITLTKGLYIEEYLHKSTIFRKKYFMK